MVSGKSLEGRLAEGGEGEACSPSTAQLSDLRPAPSYILLLCQDPSLSSYQEYRCGTKRGDGR